MPEQPVNSEKSHYIFDIKRFALHDGPGIRSTAFLKGCPLSCHWCQNPEGINPSPLLWFINSQCLRCRRCIEVCPEKALNSDDAADSFIKIDRELCTKCGRCVEICPSSALCWDSRPLSAEDLAEQLMRDAVFYESSGGGVTLSGGEPMLHADYSLDVLTICRKKGFHTALESTLFAVAEVVDRFIKVVDLFLADLKLIDDSEHRNNTGVGNERILENLQRVAISESRLIVRTPLIPGISDTEVNISGIADFVAGLGGDVALELLNFNPLAESKYRALQSAYRFAETRSPLDEEHVERLKALARTRGCRVL